MRTVELFCGTKSFSNMMARYGHRTFTVDNGSRFKPDICKDIQSCRASDFPNAVDLLWASPPCQGFSVAAIGRNWNRDYTPKSESARLSVRLVRKTLTLTAELHPKWIFIENPRGMLRKLHLLDGFTRHTISYCQYGDTRMKPTDIWTNAWWWKPRPLCSRGAPCHEASPRGSKAGTQGIRGDVDRSRIPAAIFAEILEQMPTSSLLAAE